MKKNKNSTTVYEPAQTHPDASKMKQDDVKVVTHSPKLAGGIYVSFTR